MPFEIKIASVDQKADEIAVTGRVVSGAYSGPERVTLTTSDGQTLHSVVTHHSLFGVREWPLVANHEGQVTLHVAAPKERLKFDKKEPLVGVGFLWEYDKRLDVSSLLSDPRFWAFHLHSSLQSDDVEEPDRMYFDLSEEDVSGFHDHEIHEHFHSGIWPFARIALPDSRYIEVEFAADAEYQNRFWIGGKADRVLLGYDSGHFSLPAVRLAEVRALARAAKPSWHALLMIAGCDTAGYAPLEVELIEQLLGQLPGFRKDLAGPAAVSILERRSLKESKWTEDPALGWINDSRYSQRNPSGPMTILSHEQLRYIRSFFQKLES